ncbi:MAG: hypothetical protein E7490_09885 [Ruminococcaceae bacterium]|nr:hypothetical protein [Oscillospiraceae bacterium]
MVNDMVLYSIVDIRDVMSASTDTAGSDTTTVRKINGGFIELENSVAGGQPRVKRLYSTDPALYLDKRYYPF